MLGESSLGTSLSEQAYRALKACAMTNRTHADEAAMSTDESQRRRKTLHSDWSRIAAWIGMASATASVALSVPLVMEPYFSKPPPEIDREAVLNQLLDTRTVALRREIEILKQERAALLSQPPKGESASVSAMLIKRLQGIEQRQSRIEQVILSDPSKALELPLLRRDIDSMREANAAGLAAVRQSVDQVYDLSKWLLGALVVGIFSLAISNFLTKKS